MRAVAILRSLMGAAAIAAEGRCSVDPRGRGNGTGSAVLFARFQRPGAGS